MIKDKRLALIGLVLALTLCFFIYTRDANPTPQPTTADQSTDKDHQDETWHDRFLKDSRERCPECCVKIDHCENCPA